jgi:RNA polymerase sigma-70 factor (ECF subfamily)
MRSADDDAEQPIADAMLVLRARSGNHDALRALLHRHDAALRRVIGARTRNAADTEDAVQETTLKVWQGLPGLQEPAAARAWIMRIAEREAYRIVLARRQEHELTEDAAATDGPDRSVDRFDLEEGVRDALRTLAPHQARCWVLREIEGRSYREIAVALDLSEAVVRGSLVRARKHVQHAVGKFCPLGKSPSASGTPAAPVVAPAARIRPVATYPPAAPLRARATVRTALPEDHRFVDGTAEDLSGGREVPLST